MQNPNFITGECYHIYNRGVEKRDIFLEDGDFLRFVHYLYVLNDNGPLSVNFRRNPIIMYEVSPRTSPRKKLVDIFAFCLMPNHYHLFIRQKIENGISKFMQKLGTAESMFFNAKYKHTGGVFQGKFKFKKVKDDAQAVCLANYIHTNPIDLMESGWKENGVKNPQKVMDFLENYRWSSYQDYIGKKNLPSVINQEFLEGIIGRPEEFKRIMREVIFDKVELNKFLEMSRLIDLK